LSEQISNASSHEVIKNSIETQKSFKQDAQVQTENLKSSNHALKSSVKSTQTEQDQFIFSNEIEKSNEISSTFDNNPCIDHVIIIENEPKTLPEASASSYVETNSTLDQNSQNVKMSANQIGEIDNSDSEISSNNDDTNEHKKTQKKKQMKTYMENLKSREEFGLDRKQCRVGFRRRLSSVYSVDNPYTPVVRRLHPRSSKLGKRYDKLFFAKLSE
jgi:hypothetical protein